jgi:hypothetical protein
MAGRYKEGRLQPIEHHFVIEPLGGVGPIKFGMHRDEVARAFTYVYTSFFKGPWSKVRSDHCTIVGLIIHYDDDHRVEYIEVTAPEHGNVTLELFGKDVTGISVRGLLKLVQGHTSRVEQHDYGYDFPDLEMNTYNSDLRTRFDKVECLGVGRRGYSAEAVTHSSAR